MENTKITIQDMIQSIRDELNEIVVPVKYADSISRPLCRAVAGLEACLAAMEAAEEPAEVKEDV
jgi:hypothetical protein